MKRIRLLSFCAAAVIAQAFAAPAAPAEEPQPRTVTPAAMPGAPPSDAVVLFDGKDLSQWAKRDGSPIGCSIVEGVIACRTGAGDNFSKPRFRNAQIHLEFMPPLMPDQHSQARGNSGLYLHGRYEIQILDSFQNPTYANGSCAAVYGQAPPLVNASRPPENWQTYDIVFHGARCSPAGVLEQKPRITLFHNGVLVQDNVEIQNVGRGCEAGVGEPGPIMLQDHDYRGAPVTLMKFRNIWFRHLE
jgi:hypothetical protein